MRLKLFILFCLLSMASFPLFSQEKNLAYYNSHPDEIRKDAYAAFDAGNYDAAIQLCDWDFVMSGKNDLASLKKKAESCRSLVRQVQALYDSGAFKEAKQKALDVLALNPSDSVAKNVLLVDEEHASKEPEEVEQEPVIPAEDLVVKMPEQVAPEAERPVRLVVKADLGVLDMSRFGSTLSPGVSLGAYDLGGSMFGAEAGVHFCPGLPATWFEADLSAVFRLPYNIYPKIGAGFFHCGSKEGGTATNGSMITTGASVIIKGHFVLGAGISYYPAVRLNAVKSVSTAGVSYDIPVATEVVRGGISPWITVGWAF